MNTVDKHKLFLLCFLVSIIINPSIYALEKIKVNGLFKDMAVVTVDGKQHVLKKGVRGVKGILLIEGNSKEAIFEIDGQQKTYTLDTGIGNNFAKPETGEKLTITQDPRGMFNINGSINGFSVPFLVDTGATFVSMNGITAKRLGIDYKLEGQKSSAYTASGISDVYLVNLKRVRIGDIELHNVQGSVHDGSFPVETLLGMSFLKRLQMKREGRVLNLEKKY